jgi:hypothetical protein
MLLPVGIAMTIAIQRHRMFAGLGIATIATVLAAVLFVTLCSGCSSSNWGTYFRSREPGRYWFDVAIGSIIYCAICAAVWFVN